MDLFRGLFERYRSAGLGCHFDDCFRCSSHSISHFLLSLIRLRRLLSEQAHLVNCNCATRSQSPNILTGPHLRGCDRIKTSVCHSLELVGQSSAGIWQCSFNHPCPSSLTPLSLLSSSRWGRYPTIEGACRHTALSACRLHTPAARLHHC